MKRELLAICGPFSINSYGAAIVVGILIFLWFIKKHPKAQALHLDDTITDIVLVSVFAGIIGGRLWYILSEPITTVTLSDFFSVWDGGFSLLGTIISIVVALTFFFKKLHMPILPNLDMIALHAPLLQSISRMGCFLAGCCYGYPTNRSWGFIYTDPQSMAPLYIMLHPTQLYSALTLLIIFFLLYGVVQKFTTKPGQLLAFYLMFISLERFFLDFWRADRITFSQFSTLTDPIVSYSPSTIRHFTLFSGYTILEIISIQQIMALIIFTGAAIALTSISFSISRKNP